MAPARQIWQISVFEDGLIGKGVNSYAWGMAPRGHLTFKVVFGIFVCALPFRPKMVIPTKKTFKTYVLYRLSSKFSLTEKKIISHGPFSEFCSKIEFNTYQFIPTNFPLIWINGDKPSIGKLTNFKLIFRSIHSWFNLSDVVFF